MCVSICPLEPSRAAVVGTFGTRRQHLQRRRPVFSRVRDGKHYLGIVDPQLLLERRRNLRWRLGAAATGPFGGGVLDVAPGATAVAALLNSCAFPAFMLTASQPEKMSPFRTVEDAARLVEALPPLGTCVGISPPPPFPTSPFPGPLLCLKVK